MKRKGEVIAIVTLILGVCVFPLWGAREAHRQASWNKVQALCSQPHKDKYNKFCDRFLKDNDNAVK